MTVYGQTDAGCVRPNNQDAFRMGVLSQNASFAVVCDGMGGAAGGSVASTMAVKMIEDRLRSGYRDDMSEISLQRLLETTVMAANALVYDESMENSDLRGMGTTAVVAVVRDWQAFTAHVGDSRIYLIEEDIEQLTRDHSIVQEMVERGQLTEEEAKHHPLKHFITRAVGVDSRVDVDLDVFFVSEKAGLLLCSDGLTNMVEPDTILSVIQTANSADVPDQLVNLAKEAGGTDNITVVWMAP